MNFKYVNNIDSMFKQKHYLKDRNISILEFQMRILDLVYLEDTPFMEKLKFLKIINSNLHEFISTRLPDSNNKENLIHIIESIYRKMGKIISDIVDSDGISYTHSKYQYMIKDKSFQYIYAGESSDEIVAEMTEVLAIKNSITTRIVLSNDCAYQDADILIVVPTEIFLLDKLYTYYESKYSEIKKHYFEPNVEKTNEIDFYEYLRYRDMLIRNPYESYDNVLMFIDQMCTNPSIICIFITLYRTAKDSEIIKSLIRAKKLGKEVYVYIEPTARDNEELNIENIRILQKHNIYVECSYYNYKVHAKLFCAIDMDKTVYAHIGTGNYNESTAKQYTDCHLLTHDQSIAKEAARIMLTLFRKEINKIPSVINNHLFSSPLNFRTQIIKLINDERRKGVNGHIYIKCNSICDCAVIDRLYQAAEDGVKIKIICRTGCSIRLHNNIEVRSKVGQYLEHDRIYIFGEKAFISSADLLLRNINKRVETLCEIKDYLLSNKIKKIFFHIWNDKNIHLLQEDGKWKIR